VTLCPLNNEEFNTDVFDAESFIRDGETGAEGLAGAKGLLTR
jgi:hypothetical protein